MPESFGKQVKNYCSAIKIERLLEKYFEREQGFISTRCNVEIQRYGGVAKSSSSSIWRFGSDEFGFWYNVTSIVDELETSITYSNGQLTVDNIVSEQTDDEAKKVVKGALFPFVYRLNNIKWVSLNEDGTVKVRYEIPPASLGIGNIGYPSALGVATFTLSGDDIVKVVYDFDGTNRITESGIIRNDPQFRIVGEIDFVESDD